MNIKKRMTVLILRLSLVFFILIIGVIIKYAFENTVDYAILTSKEVSKEVEIQLEEALLLSRNLSETYITLRRLGKLDRNVANELLKQKLNNNQSILGIWTCWEANAFDGLDQTFANTNGHDETGRFIPYWYRNKKGINHVPLYGYEIKGIGDYYLLAKESLEETLIDPFFYKIDDKDVELISIAVPIVDNGVFLGVVGADFTIKQLQSILESINIYESGYGVLLTHSNKIISTEKARNDTRVIASIVDKIDDQNSYFWEFNNTLKDDVFYSVTPIQIGKVEKKWMVMVAVRRDEILAESYILIRILLLLGAVGLFIMGVTMHYNLSQITTPLSMITDHAIVISNGNFDEKIPAELMTRQDEFGVLSLAMQKMARNINDYIYTLKNSKELIEISKVKYQSLVESSADWIWETDVKGNFTYVSPQVTQMLHISSREMLNNNMMKYVLDVGDFSSILKKIHDGVEVKFQTLDKEVVTIEMKGVAIKDESTYIKGYRGINRNITLRKKYEEQLFNQSLELKDKNKQLELYTSQLEEIVQQRTDKLEKMILTLKETQSKLVESGKVSALGNLIFGISHELNTPIGSNITLSSFLKEKTEAALSRISKNELSVEELLAYLAEVNSGLEINNKNLEKMSSLVEKFKLLSPTDYQKAQVEDINLLEIFNKIVKYIASYRNDMEDIDILLDVSSNIVIDSNEKVWNIILSELITNSIKHGFDDENKKAIVISASEDLSKNTIIIEYSDSGRGLDKAIVSNVFDPFVSTRENDDDVGLGLHIVSFLVTNIFFGSINYDVEDDNKFKLRIELSTKSST